MICNVKPPLTHCSVPHVGLGPPDAPVVVGDGEVVVPAAGGRAAHLQAGDRGEAEQDDEDEPHGWVGFE